MDLRSSHVSIDYGYDLGKCERTNRCSDDSTSQRGRIVEDEKQSYSCRKYKTKMDVVFQLNGVFM
jgi:hypothetical protein